MAKPTPKNPKWKQIKDKLDNPVLIKKLEKAFLVDCSIKQACLFAWISKQCYYDLIAYKPELVEHFALLRENPVMIAKRTVVEWISTDSNLAFKYLEKRSKDFQELEAKAPVNINLNIKNMEVSTMSAEQLEKLKNELLK